MVLAVGDYIQSNGGLEVEVDGGRVKFPVSQSYLTEILAPLAFLLHNLTKHTGKPTRKMDVGMKVYQYLYE